MLHTMHTTSGGGILIFIKKNFRFQRLSSVHRLGMEVQSIRVFLARREWIDLTNVYIPNTTTQTTVFDPAVISTSPSSLVLGDFNGHSPLWDEHLDRDERGELIENWLIESNLFVLNDGSVTRQSRVENGSPSTPDLTLAGEKWSAKCSWTTLEGIGSSDHLPIEISLTARIAAADTPSRPAKWKHTGIDWALFTAAVKESVDAFQDEPDRRTRFKPFYDTLKDAGNKHVGKTKPGKNTKAWLTPTVRGKIRKRNTLR